MAFWVLAGIIEAAFLSYPAMGILKLISRNRGAGDDDCVVS
jgi:hypothetical protein